MIRSMNVPLIRGQDYVLTYLLPLAVFLQLVLVGSLLRFLDRSEHLIKPLNYPKP